MRPSAGEKPYRLYRGGRVKGKVPSVPPPARPEAPRDGGVPRYPGPGPKRRPQPSERWRWRRRIAFALVAFILLVGIWLLAGYLAVRGGVSAANKRLPAPVKASLAPDGGMLLFHPSDVLLLGIDHSPARDRAGDRHSDSIMVVRTDPAHHRLTYLSIPRDLRVDIPGHGPDKINTAYQIGGARLAAATVHSFTGLPINHVVVVDFANFKDVVDALGGITVDVPRAIVSNNFDCPYDAQRCQRWPGWHFGKGPQHMNGQRAMIYSRIRKNRLDAADNDITRGTRQQQVLQALGDRLTSPAAFVRMPFVGGDLVKPLTTDLSTNQFVQLGWLKYRAGRVLHCRLGGSSDGGAITPSEDNANVVLMVRGISAPQPPPPSGDTFPPGCLVSSGSSGGGTVGVLASVVFALVAAAAALMVMLGRPAPRLGTISAAAVVSAVVGAVLAQVLFGGAVKFRWDPAPLVVVIGAAVVFVLALEALVRRPSPAVVRS
jgi:LCP family protein required for cell wall assembly